MKTLLLIINLAAINCFAINYKIQKSNDDSINVISKDGKKQGYWIENVDGLRLEMYYNDGILNGLFKSFYQNSSIAVLGFYKNGEMTDNWYYFDEKGRLLLEQSLIKKVSPTKKSNSDAVQFKNSAYFKFYHRDGKIKEEGFGYYNDVEEHIEKFGAWKIYDLQGKLSKKEYNK